MSYKDKKERKIDIDIDYHLFELIKEMNEGYNINASDKNSHADFNGFITKIIETGNKNKEVLIVSKDNPNNMMTIKKDAFEEIEVTCTRDK